MISTINDAVSLHRGYKFSDYSTKENAVSPLTDKIIDKIDLPLRLP